MNEKYRIKENINMSANNLQRNQDSKRFATQVNKTYKNIRSVNLRHFQSVPKCDLEFVLPEQAQKVYMRPMDKLLLCFSFIGGTGVASHFYFTGLQFTQAGVIALIGFCAYFIHPKIKIAQKWLERGKKNAKNIHAFLTESRCRFYRRVVIVGLRINPEKTEKNFLPKNSRPGQDDGRF